MDPNRSSPVMNYAESTLRELVAMLEMSPEPEQCIYREAELDDLIRQVEADLLETRAENLGKLLQAALDAHSLVASGNALGAARRLGSVLEL